MKVLTTCPKCKEVAFETKENPKPDVIYESDCHYCAYGVIQYRIKK